MPARALTLSAAALAFAAPAFAQRADENVVRAASDAFGVSIGNERIGLYNDRDVRGFSPIAAGNVRLEGLYYDMRSNVPSRLVAGQQIRVGLTAQSYPLPAPTGIVDYSLKQVHDRNAFSVLLEAGPHDAYSIEVDGEIRIIPGKLGLAGAALYRVEEFVPEDSVAPWGIGLVSRWRPVEGTEVMSFYGYGERVDDKAYAFVFTSGPFLPPDIEAKGFAQDWTGIGGYIEAYGVTVRHPLSPSWTLNAGLFRHNSGSEGPIAELFLNTDAAGLAAQHRFIDEPDNEQRALSGEARLTGVFQGENLRHTVFATLRGRESRRNFGGASIHTFGPAQIGVRQLIPQPVWTYGGGTFDEITQWSLGAGYQLAWRGLGEASIGAQSIDYEKRITPPLSDVEYTTDADIFPSASLALTITDRLALYASYTEGLEESPVAPEIAVNAYESPPAIRTEQRELGLRYGITPRLRFVAGYFEVTKPYFNLDPGGLFRELGTETHRGVEMSLSGLVTDRLNIVAGLVLMDPVVEGEAVDANLIGPRPIGQAETTARLNLDYRTPWIEGLSLDAAVTYTGPRAATSREFAALGGAQLETEEFATLDLGFRYRFDPPFANAATLRMQITNVTDEFAWQVMSSGALYVSNPRGVRVSLTADF